MYKEVYNKIKEQKNKIEKESFTISHSESLSDEQKKSYLDENFGIIKGLNQALRIIDIEIKK